ncbi:MAG: hypothetical protein JSV92_01340 [archaeon]|nr:MAG: hypothetical protein JSV92_01340 [archaeon]
MKESLRTGICFGTTSGIITTLGLIVGLHAGTHSRLVIIGGILTIAIADAFSDSLGIHVSEESENKHTGRELWESTACTFIAKFFFAMTFIAPILVLELYTAIIVSVAWGLLILAGISYYVSRVGKEKPWKVVLEHLVIAMIVIAITHYVGDWIGMAFV